jgi:tetrapyrrole methylase family protein / MazG family protein
LNDPQAGPESQFPPSSGVLDRSLDLVEFLRARCPWDAAQTHQSLRRYLLDESHEVVDAIDAGDDAGLRDELGDLLLNVAFQIVVAEERSAFDRAAVVEVLEEKMRRRHPHLYGGEHESWDSIKARESGNETGDDTLLGDLVAGRDPLGHSDRLQKRVAEVGFDWPDAAGAWEKVVEEVEEVRQEAEAGDPARLEEELGDLLFAVVNFARLSGIHPSTALSRANAKFTRRFNRLEELAKLRGVVLGEASLEALDEVWNEVKREER